MTVGDVLPITNAHQLALALAYAIGGSAGFAWWTRFSIARGAALGLGCFVVGVALMAAGKVGQVHVLGWLGIGIWATAPLLVTMAARRQGDG